MKKLNRQISNRIFIYTVGIDLIRDELFSFWKTTGSIKIIPDPLEGICYFSRNVEDIISRFANVKVPRPNYFEVTTYINGVEEIHEFHQ